MSAWRWVWMVVMISGGLDQPVWAGSSLEAISRQYATPEHLVQFLHREFHVHTDSKLFGVADYWQTPEEFLVRRAGDCEDYALFAQAILHQHGRVAHVVSLYGPHGYAHTVCVFVEHGRYHVINQDRLIRLDATSLSGAISALVPGWTFGGIAEQCHTRGRLLVPLHP